MPKPPLQPKVVLGVAAHADDLEFTAAGTMAGFAAAGTAVHALVLTDGSKGTADRGTASADLVRTRQAEQSAAAAVLGLAGVTFGGFEDGALANTVEVRRRIVQEIRRLKPDVVMTWDPTMVYAAAFDFINHPDHRAAGQAALDAVYPLARDHLSYPELLDDGFEPHKVGTVLLVNFNHPDYLNDISTTLGTKLNALAEHASQDGAGHQALIRTWAAHWGREAGCEAAEAFVRVDID